MARRKRPLPTVGMSFLDAMTCGFGAVILFFMIIQANVGLRQDRLSLDLQAEVDRLEVRVLEGRRNLALLRNGLEEVDRERVTSRGLSRRLLETLEEIEAELATYEDETLAQHQDLNRLQEDLKSLEEQARRLEASVPEEETPGERVRAFVGEGDRQYLTGLKIGGERVMILVDASASMLDDTVVNVVRRRNLPPEERRRAGKWRRVVSAVDWLATQLPRDGHFQLYSFAETAAPVVEGTEGTWLDAGDPRDPERAVSALRSLAPEGGTSLERGLRAAAALDPPPDNLILLTDGLPTRGTRPPRRPTVSGRERLRLFRDAVEAWPSEIPVNVLLFPMEGDPMASPAFWKLAMRTRGSLITPSEAWP